MTNTILYQVPNAHDTQPAALLAFPELADSPLARLLEGAEDKWLIESCGGDGLNVRYHLLVTTPKGGEYQIILPWLAQEICPNCQGEGLIYRWGKNNDDYECLDCPECQGEGSINHDSDIRITVNDSLRGQRVIRKSRAGRLNPRLGLRGDLIVQIEWVDELPQDILFDTPASQAPASTN
ncbi:MAG: hypothetical protein LBV79_12470 [Candidatus Adiutrix sp.]|jgi:Zn ribbon nucleic-acid-binding protein|nr:hypothetical protein [Candidatus Adiutrix sp.]